MYEDKHFWNFPHRVLNNLTLGLPYSLRTLELDPPLPIWRAIYWSSWMHWRRRILKIKETIVNCCLTCLCLSPHPFVPLEHTLLLFPSLPFPCKLAIEMGDWSGGELGFSISTRCGQSLSLFYLCLLLIEISISHPLHVYSYEYFIHGCSYISLYMMVLYMLE